MNTNTNKDWKVQLAAVSIGALALFLWSAGPLGAQETHSETKTKTSEKARPPNKPGKQEDKPNKQIGKSEQKKGGERQADQEPRSAQRNSSRNGGLRTAGSGRRLESREFSQNFGANHRFRPGWIGNSYEEFGYGGYTFGFLEPWPLGWAYTDDVYVMDIDGSYVLCNAMYPGVTIGVVIE